MPIAGFIDTETTGLYPGTDEIVELAIVLFSYDAEHGEILDTVDEYSGLREPNCPVSESAANVHGLTEQKLKGCSLDNARITGMIERADFLVAHNAQFDRGFMGALFPGAASMPWRCSMNSVNWRSRGFFSKGLQNLLRDHRIVPTAAHRALSDVKATLELLSQADRSGVPYFRELLKSEPIRAPRSARTPMRSAMR